MRYLNTKLYLVFTFEQLPLELDL